MTTPIHQSPEAPRPDHQTVGMSVDIIDQMEPSRAILE